MKTVNLVLASFNFVLCAWNLHTLALGITSGAPTGLNLLGVVAIAGTAAAGFLCLRSAVTR